MYSADPCVSVAANLHTRSAASSSWRSRTVLQNVFQWRTFTTGWLHISRTLRTPQQAGRTLYDTISRSTNASRKSIKTRVRWVAILVLPTGFYWQIFYFPNDFICFDPPTWFLIYIYICPFSSWLTGLSNSFCFEWQICVASMFQ